MKKFLILYTLFFVSSIASQNEVNELKNNWYLSISTGNANLEAENFYKINVNLSNGTIAKSFFLNDNFSLITGIGVSRLSGNYENQISQQKFIKNEYISIPFSLRFNQKSSNLVSIFSSFGIYGTYLYKSKLEDLLNNDFQTFKNLGFNFGIQGNIGAKLKVDDKTFFDLSIDTRTDLISSFKSNSQQYKVKDFMGFQIGFGFIF